MLGSNGCMTEAAAHAVQVKLRELLMEKSREARANMEAAAAFSRGLRSKAPKSHDIQVDSGGL